MEKIKHYNLPEHTNRLYEEEAISSIGLTHDIADKINELVDAYNELNKTNLEKIHEQDGIIAKGVLYMKDNLINSIHDLFKLLQDSGELKGIITDIVLKGLTDVEAKTEGMTNIKEYGAVGDGIQDDTDALEEALKHNDHVFIPDGIYKINRTIKIPNNKKIHGANRNTTILKFKDGVNGLQLNHSTTVEDVTVSFSGDCAGLYVYTPDNYNYALSSIVRNVRLTHESDDITGCGILMVAEKVSDSKPNGAYNLKYEDIDIRNKVKYGIKILNKAKTTSASECWFTDIKFDNVFINACETAINIDWENVSGIVPLTGKGPKNDGIYFTNVNAQYVEGLSKKFARIMNAINVKFDKCFSFDYWHLYPEDITIYTFNALETMCRVDLGNLPEVSDLYANYPPRYIDFINSSGDFWSDAEKVITYMKMSTGSIYGKFINYDKTYENFMFEPLALLVDADIDNMWNTHPELISNGAMRYSVQAPNGDLVLGRETETSGVQIFLTTSLSDAPKPIIYARIRWIAGVWRDKYKISFE